MADGADRPRARRDGAAGAGEEAVEAWRTADGLTLVVFLPSGERALLEGRALADLPEEELRELRGRAVPLTPTEAVYRAPDGRRWLAQATGPAWAPDAASGVLGTRFTSLDGAHERFDVAGTPLTAPPGDPDRRERELAALWRVGVGLGGDADEGVRGDGRGPGGEGAGA